MDVVWISLSRSKELLNLWGFFESLFESLCDEFVALGAKRLRFELIVRAGEMGKENCVEGR